MGSSISADATASGTAITTALLQGYEGKNILDICGRSYDQMNKEETEWESNHCAHFISHILSIRLGTLCWTEQPGGRRTAASPFANGTR